MLTTRISRIFAASCLGYLALTAIPLLGMETKQTQKKSSNALLGGHRRSLSAASYSRLESGFTHMTEEKKNLPTHHTEKRKYGWVKSAVIIGLTATVFLTGVFGGIHRLETNTSYPLIARLDSVKEEAHSANTNMGLITAKIGLIEADLKKKFDSASKEAQEEFTVIKNQIADLQTLAQHMNSTISNAFPPQIDLPVRSKKHKRTK